VENCSSGEDPDDEEDPIVDDEVLQELEDNKQAIEDAINNQNITPVIENLATDSTNKATEQTQNIVNALTGGTSTVDPLTLLQAVDTITGTAATGTKVAASDLSSEDTQAALVENSIAITTGAAVVLNTLADAGATLDPAQIQQVNSIVSNTLDTLNNIADTTASTPAQLTELVKQANEITQARAALGIAATEEESAKVEELSRELAVAVIRKELGNNVTEEQIGELLKADSSLLEDIVSASLDLPPTATEPAETTRDRIRTAYLNRFGGLIIPPVPQPVMPRTSLVTFRAAQLPPPETVTFVLTGENGGGASTALSDGRQTLAATSYSITQNEVTGEVLIELPGESYTGTITAIKAVPTSVPAGLSFLADGTVVIVRDGLAVQLAPVSVDQLGFLGATVGAGFTPDINASSGSFVLDLGGNQKFSGAFAYDNLTGKDLQNCGDISFTEPAGALNSANYAFVATCSNSGVTQRIQPYVYSADFFSSLSGHGLSGRIDRNTGFVTVAGVGTFKLGFFVNAPTSAETAYLTANGDAFGLAFEGGDFNGDGRLDYKIISASGVQLLLGTN
jgi:hypothetical protein